MKTSRNFFHWLFSPALPFGHLKNAARYGVATGALVVLALPSMALAAPSPQAKAVQNQAAQNNSPQKAGGSPKAAHGNPQSLELNERGVQALNESRFEQAEDLFRRALAADPRNLTAVFNLSGILLNNKKISESVSLLESYTKEYTQDPGLFARLGDAYFANKQLKQALESYDKAFALDQTYPQLPNRLAIVHGLLNQPKEVEKYLKIATERDAKDYKAMASYGSVLLSNGKVDEAIQAVKQSLQVKPSSEAYVTLGTAYEARGDLKNSLISFQRARDLGDSRSELKERIAALEKRVLKDA